jgi:hypothetical protein
MAAPKRQMAAVLFTDTIDGNHLDHLGFATLLFITVLLVLFNIQKSG